MAEASLASLMSHVVDNRGRTCPTAETGFPLIATNCVKSDGLYPTFEKVRHVDEDTYRNWFRGHPIPGDLIFVLKGSPGEVCLTPDPVPFCIAQDMVALRPDPEKVYPPYLFAALRSDRAKNDILNMHVGTMIPHFKKGDFDRLFIPIPDEDDQRAIGDAYLTISKKIELNRRMNETLEEMARALFRDWFVDFGPTRRQMQGATDPAAIMGHALPAAEMPAQSGTGSAPGTSTTKPLNAITLAPLFPAKLGDNGLPEGWEMGSIGDHMSIFDSKRVPLSSREREKRLGPYPYHGATSVMGYVDDFLFDDIILLLGEDGSVIRPNGKPFTQYVWGKVWVNNHAHVLKGTTFSTEQLKVVFDNVDIAPFTTGAVQLKLNQKNMKSVPLVVAGLAVHAAYDEMILPLFAKIRANTEENQTLAALRDLLLPKLMSGEIRLNDAEAVAE